MPQPKIPDEVVQLILSRIPSVERLEILLLLFDGRNHTWSPGEVEEQIRSTRESVTQNIRALVESGLGTTAGPDAASVQYRPASTALDSAVTELALVYRTRRVAVIELIYSDRKAMAQSFSDAFRLTKPHDS